MTYVNILNRQKDKQEENVGGFSNLIGTFALRMNLLLEFTWKTKLNMCNNLIIEVIVYFQSIKKFVANFVTLCEDKYPKIQN